MSEKVDQIRNITTKQLDYIESLQKRLEYQKYTILDIASEICGKRIQHFVELDIKQASVLIEQLKDLLGE